MAQWEYKTEVLTSIGGRDKLQMDDFEDALRDHGNDCWELVSVNLEVSIRAGRDGHLLVFKRPKQG